MKDPSNPKNAPDSSGNLDDTQFNSQGLGEGGSSPQPPLELKPPVDPWTLPTQVGAAEELAPLGAVEVGGAGTGTWVWVSTLVAGNPIAAGALLILSLGAIAGAVWWGVSTRAGTPKAQIEARSDIANNPLPDNPQPYKDATAHSPASEGAPRAPSSTNSQGSGGVKQLNSTQESSSSDFDGQWKCVETGERITISHSSNNYYSTFFDIKWVLTRSGNELKESHRLTTAEISALFNAPGNIARQVVGAPAVLVLTLSDANRIVYATAAPRSIRRNPRTGKLSLTPGPPLSGTLVRLKKDLKRCWRGPPACGVLWKPRDKPDYHAP